MTNQTVSRNKNSVTKIAITAMLTAVAVVLQYIEMPVPLVPSFLKIDFSDVPELIGAFVISPIYGVIICLLKNIIHLPFGSSVGVGEFANFLFGAVFAFTLPFTFVKGIIDAVITMLIYKPLSNMFVKMNTALNQKSKKSDKKVDIQEDL